MSSNESIEGIDAYHACESGEAAMPSCLNYAGHASCDGRWALAVMVDLTGPHTDGRLPGAAFSLIMPTLVF